MDVKTVVAKMVATAVVKKLGTAAASEDVPSVAMAVITVIIKEDVSDSPRQFQWI